MDGKTNSIGLLSSLKDEKGSTPGKVLFLALFSALFIVLLLQIVLLNVLKKVQ